MAKDGSSCFQEKLCRRGKAGKTKRGDFFFFQVGRKSFGASANGAELVQRQLQEDNVGGNVRWFFHRYIIRLLIAHLKFCIKRCLFPEALNREV